MNDSQLRDQLAVDRTALANERTLLAYLRTALAFAAAGAAILHFYANTPSLTWVAVGLIVAGGLTGIVGGIRFLQVQRRLK